MLKILGWWMINQDNIIIKTTEFVKEKLASDSSGHDWWHVHRVWKTAVYIGEKEEVDLAIVQLAALLHDIADWKFYNGDTTVGPQMAAEWLGSLHVEVPIIEHVCEIIQDVSFKGAGVPTAMKTKEGMVVQDADRLDAIGAIGIARTFAYGGTKGHPIHTPLIGPELHQSFEDYQSSEGSVINHFYEKLLLLKGRMNTETAKKLADSRHRYMELFLEQFFHEWNFCSAGHHSELPISPAK